MTEKDIYDKRKFYKTKLEPLIHELKLQCNMEHMPMFVTVAVKNDKAGTEYASDMVLAGSGTELENNRISKLLLELNNIHQKYPDYNIGICVDIWFQKKFIQIIAKNKLNYTIALSIPKLL